MCLDQVFCLIDDFLTEDHNQNREHAEAHQTPADNGHKKRDWLHLKHSGGKDQQLEWRRRRKHGRNHEGKKFLALKAIANAFEARFINPLEQKEFTAGPSQAVGNKATQS